MLLAITILFASLGATTATDTTSNNTQIEATAPAIIEESTPIGESTSYSIEKDTTAQKDKKILKADNTQTIYVNSNGDDLSDGSDINNPTTITNALKLVQDNGEIHLVTSGDTDTYANRIPISNVTVPRATNFSIIGQEGKTIILNGENTHRIMNIYSGYNITLKNLIFLNGFVSNGYGGAIENFGNLIITNSTLYNNTASTGGVIVNRGNLVIIGSILTNNNVTGSGGVIYNNGNLSIINSTINNNNATGFGGAIYNERKITIVNSTLSDNIARAGGAIFNQQNTNATLINSTLTYNNVSNGGGAIFNYISVNMTILNNTIAYNKANNYGGAIYNQGSSNGNINMVIVDSTLNNNTITSYGGAIFNQGNVNMTLTNNTLVNNTANSGGAIFNYLTVNITITNNTLINNIANLGGGAIFNQGNVNMTLTKSTLTSNSAKNGGAIYNDRYNNNTISNNTFNNNTATQYGGAIYNIRSGTMILTNNTLANNTANSGGALYNFNGTVTIEDSVMENNTASGVSVKTYSEGSYVLNGTEHTGNSTGAGSVTLFDDNTVVLGSGITIIVNGTALTLDDGVDRLAGGAILYDGAFYLPWDVNLTVDNTVTTLPNGTMIVTNGTIILENGTNISSNINPTTAELLRDIITLPGSKIVLPDGAVLFEGVNVSIRLDDGTPRGGGGGAIVNDYNATMTITNTSFINNTAERMGDGGAIYNQMNSTLNINNSTFENNTAYDGGAIYTNTESNTTINDTILSYNKANIGSGGAIFNDNNSTLILTYNTIFNNTAAINGGAIVNRGSTLNLTNNTINNNTAQDAGGAIYNRLSNSTITNNTLSNNTAVFGGAIRNLESSIIDVINNTLVNNTATINGGAVHNSHNSSITIMNNTLSYNTANSTGGSIFSTLSSSLMILDSEFYNNSVTSSNGYVVDFRNSDRIEITDSVFVNNTDGVRDMLFSDADENASVDIHGNTYIDNCLESYFVDEEGNPVTNYTIGLDYATYKSSHVLDVPIYMSLRDIYNDTVRSGTVYLKYHSTGLVSMKDVDGNEILLPVTLSALDEYNNDLELNYTSQGKNYQNINSSSLRIMLTDIPTTINVDPVEVAKIGENVTIAGNITDAEGQPVANQNITIIVNDDQIPVTTDENGTFNTTITTDTLGTNNITVVYPGDENWNATSQEASFEVEKQDSVITIDPINTVKVGENITITGNIVDGLDNPVSNENITITVNGEEKTVTTDDDGSFEYNYTTSIGGPHNLTVSFDGNNNTNGESINETFDVDKITTSTTATILNDTLGNVTIKVTVTTTDGDKVDIGNITVFNEYNMPITGLDHVPLVDGEATIKIPSQNAGENLSLTIHYNENDVYNASTAENTSLSVDDPNRNKTNINVSKIPTITTVNILNTTLGNVTIKVTVTNSTNDKVDRGTITILNKYNMPITGLDEVTLTGGEITLTIPSQKAGENITITVHYNENDVYQNSSAVNDTQGNPLNITVQPHDSILTVNVTNGTPDNTQVNINLTDDAGEPIPNAPITITDENNNPVGNGTTGPDGTATIPVTLPVGDHNITVSYPGDENHKPANKTVPVTTDKHNTTLDVTPENGTVIVNATNENGTPIPNIPINITDENGTVIANGTTDENGTAVIPVPLEPGDHNITITTPGDENNTGTNTTIPITIPPKDTNMNVTVTNGTTPSVKVNLTDDEGNPISDAPISITDENNNPVGNGTTGQDGTADIPVTLPTGDHNITVSYPGDENHKPTNQTVPVTVEKHNTTLNVTPENGTVVVNATNENGTPIPNIPINITDENGTVIANGTTDENGTAVIPVPLPPGDHNITISTPGDENNTGTNTTIPITIPSKDPNMSLEVTNGSTPTVKVNLTDSEGNPISDAPITITDKDGNEIANGTTGPDGTTTIPVTLPTGEHNITVTYPGDNEHNPREETTTVNVTPKESQTNATITNNTVGNVTIEVEVVDPVSGEPLTGPVNIIVDDQVVGNGTLDSEGKAVILVDIDKKGNYTIIVEYPGNDDYNGSNDTLEDVYIKGKDADVNVVIDNQVVGNTTVNATITDPVTNEPIPNATVIVTLPNGTNVTDTTDENGTAIITVDLPSGDNNITVTYPGSDDYETNKQNITVKVKSYSTVTVDPVEGVVLDNVTFTAHVVDYQGNPVNGGYVIFKVGGRTLTYANGTQIRSYVLNGVATLSYTAESGWIVDSHPNLSVEATYSGTSIVLSNRSDTSKVTIYKRNATVQVSAPDDYVNGTLHIDAVVRDHNGSPINDGVLVFKLNGLSLKDANNKAIVAKVSNGRVHLDVKLPFAYSAKTYNLTATYSNKIYNKATAMNTTSLKAIPTYINATVTIKDQFTKPVVTGQIYNQYNNAILEGTAIINIKFDGISYAKKVTIQNGTFSETLEGISIYKPGTHKVEIAAGANSHYEAVRKTITSKATPKYAVTPVITNITRNKTTTRVQAKLVDAKNNNVQKDLRITIKLNGKSFLVNQTVRNGKVDVLVDTSTLKNRTYSLEIVSGANTYYNAGKATTELPKY